MAPFPRLSLSSRPESRVVCGSERSDPGNTSNISLKPFLNYLIALSPLL